jgi:hypothetical protein
MEKLVKFKQIGQISHRFEPFSPINHSTNPTLYLILSNQFENFERWTETEKIDRKEFEKLLHGHEELVDAYLDEFSKKAVFYECNLYIEKRVFQYFIMKKSTWIALIFYRNMKVLEL